MDQILLTERRLMEKLLLLQNKIKENYPNYLISGNCVDVYSSREEELYCIVNGVGIRNVSDRNFISLKGKDVLEFLNRIATNNIKTLPVAGFLRTLFTNEKGRIIDRTTLISLDNKFLLISNCNCDTRIKSWIEKYIITEDVSAEVVTGDYCLFEIYGYQAESYLSMFCGDVINNLPENRITFVSYEDIQFFLFKQKETDDVGKYLILSSSEHCEKLVDYLIQNKSVFDFSFVGEQAYEIFRIKNGIPKFPHELKDEFNPHEANLLCDVASNKGCYIGQEVIARLETYDKVQKQLKGLLIESEVLPEPDTEITNKEGEVVGKLTSVTDLPNENRALGLGYIRNAFADEGKELFVETEAGRLSILVKNLPIQL